ncbi:DUF4369 domain-containing protein [Mangrovibacterium lignilyticum]|uniref:DUF4369 domain-containing protein n=1 Tax=Mangrovibacterium lignilyticum TaxID=2668052 RepID=UPI0013D56CEE|nr:DUF4369 domain-containing protein [Mangrovibacterium lignilyticum]
MRHFVVLFIILIVACQPNSHFSIQGQMPDTTFDGEQVYLVPVFGATVENVDSCTIEQGKFKFEGTPTPNEVFILRTKPMLRLKAQDQLVIKEQGIIWVEMNQNSFVTGTATNDSIQAWKEQKIKLDQQVYELQLKRRNSPDSLQETAQAKLDSLIAIGQNFHFRTAELNQDNALGKMLRKMLQQSPSDTE